jgi:hypothetical protein
VPVHILWIAAVALSYLQLLQEFPQEMFQLMSRMEIGLVYMDAVVSLIVLLIGVFRYLRDVLENQ